MPYLDDVLALSPSIHWPLDDESGTVVADASGNGHNATIVSLSGSQYVRRVESVVRNILADPLDAATLLNTSLSATSGVGRISLGNGSDPVGAGAITGSYTFGVWGRWKRSTNSIFMLQISGSEGSGIIEFWLTTTSARLDHVQPGHIGGTQSRTFNWPSEVRADSRHFFVARFDASTGLAAIFVDGVKIGEQAHQAIHSSMSIRRFLMGDTSLAPQRPWRHYVQHASFWLGTALTDEEIEGLWLSGRDRPGRETVSVNFGEDQYDDGVSAITAGHWDKIWNTGNVSYAVVEDSAEALIGGRILDVRSGANQAQLRWLDAPREPQQRFLARCRVTAGFNLELGFCLLGGWDYTSQSTFGGASGSAIEIGLSGNNLRVRQKRSGETSNSTLATAALVRAAGDWVYVRGEVDSYTLEVKAKAWHDGDPEPASWMIETTMDAQFQYGDGFFAITIHPANTFAEIDFIDLDVNSGPPLGTPVIEAEANSNEQITVTTLTPGANAEDHRLYGSTISPVPIEDAYIIADELGEEPEPVVQTGLVPETTYFYRLAAIKGAEVELSEEVSATTAPLDPTFPGPRKLFVGGNGAILRYGVSSRDRDEVYVPLAESTEIAASPVGAEAEYFRVHMPITNHAQQLVLVEIIVDGAVRQEIELVLAHRARPTREVYIFDLYEQFNVGAQEMRAGIVGTWFKLRVSVPSLAYRGLIFEQPVVEASGAHELFQEAVRFSPESVALMQAQSSRQFYVGGDGAIYRCNAGVLDAEQEFVPLATSAAVAPYGPAGRAVAEKLFVTVLRMNESPVDVVFTLNVDGVDRYTELRTLAGVAENEMVAEVLEFTLAADFAIGNETVRGFVEGNEFQLRASIPDGLPDGLMIFEERQLLVRQIPNTVQGV